MISLSDGHEHSAVQQVKIIILSFFIFTRKVVGVTQFCQKLLNTISLNKYKVSHKNWDLLLLLQE